MVASLVPVSLLKMNGLFCTEATKAVQHEGLCREADRLTSLFKQQPRVEPRDAQSLPAVLEGRRFFKELPKIADPKIETCRKEHLALKLGIPSEIFDHNLGFETFARENALERYLMEYHHKLPVNEDTKELSIMADGVLISWRAAKDLMSHFPLHTGSPLLPWRYGPDGLQGDDMYDWSRLKPFKREPVHDWGDRYVFELAVCCGDTPHMTGDHGWLRLRTPKGHSYSVGLYRPGKRSPSEHLDKPLRIKRGYLMMPDVSEFWPCEIRSVRIEIQESQFFRMVAAIEKDKVEDQKIFQLFQSNCVLWATNIARDAGVSVPGAQSTIARFLTPRPLEPLLDGAERVLPSFVTVRAMQISTLALNGLQVALGAAYVDPEVLHHTTNPVRPTIRNFVDVMDPRKAVLNHPATFGNDTLWKVLAWRDEQKAALLERENEFSPEELQRLIEGLQYQVPPLN